MTPSEVAALIQAMADINGGKARYLPNFRNDGRVTLEAIFRGKTFRITVFEPKRVELNLVA